MNSDMYQYSFRMMAFQRNAFLTISIILSSALAVLLTFLFWKSDRIIVVPAVVEKEFWVDSRNVSATYLEQFGYFLGELLLSKSAQSASLQKTIILRHTDALYATTLSKKLSEEEQRLQKENAAYVFFPIDIKVDMEAKEILLTGDRTFYVSGKSVSTEREKYVLSFSNQGSRLLLKGISAR